MEDINVNATPTAEETNFDSVIDSFNSDLTPNQTTSTPEVEPKVEESAQQTEEPIQEESKTPLEQPKVKVTYNHKEKELSLDEARELAQKGLNYEKAVERARQEAQQQARDAFIAEQGYVWNNKPITTESEYKQALMEQELMQKYQNQNLPEEVIQELIQSKKFREDYESQQQAKQQEESKAKDQMDFLKWFAEENGRDFDTKKDTIPEEVWKANAEGTSLVDAYIRHSFKTMQERIKTLEHNASIASKAPVSGVTRHGSQEVAEEDDFLKGFNSI